MKIKPLVVFGFFLASFATLAGVAVVSINVRGHRAWESYAAEARQRGIKMSLQEFLPPAVPDAENFAAVPLFANLFSEDEAVRTAAAKALTLPPFDGSARSSNGGQARLVDLAGWQAAFVKSGDLPAASADPATDVLKAISQRCGPALAELAEAERRPHAVFPVKWEMGFAAMLPHISMIQNAAGIHQLRMAAHLARKDSAAAYEEFGGLMNLYRALAIEPTLIAGLVRVSVLNFAAGGVWQGLVQGSWDTASLAKIQRDLGAFDLLSDCRYAMSTERAGMNDTFEKMSSGQSPFGDAQSRAALSQNSGEQVMLRAAPHFHGWVTLNQLAINRYHDSFLSRIDETGARFHDTGPTDTALKAMQSSQLKRYFYSLAALTIPVLGSVEKNYLYGHTSLQLTRLDCALERHRVDKGAYPETLAALLPKYFDALPHDVIDGQPLRYRRTDDGRFLLYSVGMNGTDDGGATGEKTSFRDHLDWTWRWPAP